MFVEGRALCLSVKAGWWPIVAAALVGRVVIYVLLDLAGWFYGVPWDTFSRANLAWQWAQRPYFAATDYYWPPLQFWLVGAAYVLLRPLTGNTSNLLIPVAVNNLFFAGSTALVCAAARDLGGPAGAAIAAALAVAFAADIWVSDSALAEPIYTFFILLGSWLVYRRRQARTFPLELGLAGLGATATHYIGWFAAAFWAGLLGVRAVRSLAAGRPGAAAVEAAGLLLTALFPGLWALVNWRAWGNPLHFLEVARSYQAGYAGALPVGVRIGVIPAVFFEALGLMAPMGLAAALAAVRATPALGLFLSTPIWVLGCIWVATAAGLSAPYQEPRYMVVVGWPLLAAVGGMLGRAVRSCRRPVRILALGLVALLVAAGLMSAFRFSNSFGPDVREAARRVGAELAARPERKALVEVESLQGLESFAERGVIPVTSGFPDRFEFATPETFLKRVRTGEAEVAVARTEPPAQVVAAGGFEIERVGRYFILVRRGH